jgi:hypothetical protein
MTTPVVSPSATSAVSGTLVALGVGVVLFGLAILGGLAFLIIHSQRSAAPAPRRSRRPRYDDDYR